MPKPCTVCNHKDREEIDRALIAGIAYRSLASHFGLSTSALCRHTKHLARYRDDLLRHDERKYNEAMLEKLDLLEVRLDRLFKSAEHYRSLRVALDCIKEYARLLSLEQKFRAR